MNLSPRWREFLSSHDFESVHWSEIGDPKADDTEILEWAREREYVVFTNDLDFGRLLALTRGKALAHLRSRMEIFIFARFHARPGNEGAVAESLLDVVGPSREEPGCLSIHAFRSIRDPQLFYIHSRWKDEEAFDVHAGLPHTVRFLERVGPLVDHALDVTRAERLG